MKHLTPIFVLLAMVFSGCYDSHTVPPLSEFVESDNCDIADLQLLGSGGCRNITTDMVCLCRVTSSDLEGHFYRSVVVEDESGGAEIKVGLMNATSIYPIGLMVALHLNGLVVMYDNGVLQIGLPPQESDQLPRELESPESRAEHIVRSNSVMEVEPRNCTIASLSDGMSGRFIVIEALHHEPLVESEEEGEATWAEYHRFADREGNVIYIYVSPYAKIATNPIPANEIDLRGILYKELVGEDRVEQFVIKPRIANDITPTPTIR